MHALHGTITASSSSASKASNGHLKPELQELFGLGIRISRSPSLHKPEGPMIYPSYRYRDSCHWAEVRPVPHRRCPPIVRELIIKCADIICPRAPTRPVLLLVLLASSSSEPLSEDTSPSTQEGRLDAHGSKPVMMTKRDEQEQQSWPGAVNEINKMTSMLPYRTCIPCSTTGATVASRYCRMGRD